MGLGGHVLMHCDVPHQPFSIDDPLRDLINCERLQSVGSPVISSTWGSLLPEALFATEQVW